MANGMICKLKMPLCGLRYNAVASGFAGFCAMRTVPALGVMLCLLCLCHPAWAGVAVYKSVDAQGKVTYSDHPPAQQGHTVEVLVLPAVPDAAAVAEAQQRVQSELEASRALTDRMAADRREREQARRQAELERQARAHEQAQLEALRARNAPVVIEGSSLWPWPAYAYPGRPSGSHPPYPGYPGHKPPPQPPPPASSGPSMEDLINRSRPW